MAKYTFEETKHPNIHKYKTKKGAKYRVRMGYTVNGVPDRFEKMGYKSMAEAKAAIRKVEDMIEKHESHLIKNREITVREYFKLYREEKIRNKTWRKKQSVIGVDTTFNNHLLPKFGNLKLIELNRIQYQKWIDELIEKEIPVGSIDSYHNHFMAMLNHAVDIGVIERNRLRRVKIRQSDYEPKKKNLELQEFKRWLATAEKLYPDPMKFCMIYLTTFGLRRGEVNGLRPMDISFREDGLVVLNLRKARTNAEPDGTDLKTESSYRKPVLDIRGSDLIKYVLHEASEIKKDFGEILHQEDFIFINADHGKPFYVGFLNNVFDRVSDACGIKAHPHMMRHTFATEIRSAGADPRSVADYLGHKNVSMTDYYTHKTEERMEQVVNISTKRLHEG